jgi:hypothetical protein
VKIRKKRIRIENKGNTIKKKRRNEMKRKRIRRKEKKRK